MGSGLIYWQFVQNNVIGTLFAQPGIYFIEIDGTITKKVVKIR